VNARSTKSNLLNNLSSLSIKKKKEEDIITTTIIKKIILNNVGLKLLDPGPCDKK